ncbi:hypothetical protein QR680_014396 [Steinernema hermaphroditum]|uniref:Uncharacterized protein n=1 Tax=Steinernema hermaphroditum TaxID=289476 RepID=A0AA39I8R8_9BILA|nr:hypothetical protein QR680_014396 [Steinernema hermaphroditum]
MDMVTEQSGSLTGSESSGMVVMNTHILIFCIFAIGFGLATTPEPIPECYWTEWKALFQKQYCKRGYDTLTWAYAYPYNFFFPIVGWKMYCCL